MLPGMREADSAGTAAPARPAPGSAGASRRGWLAFWASLAAIILAGAAVVAVVAVTHAGGAPQLARPSGIPASVSDAQINLMGLSPVPVRVRPGFHAYRPGRARPVPVSAARQGGGLGVHGPALH